MCHFYFCIYIIFIIFFFLIGKQGKQSKMQKNKYSPLFVSGKMQFYRLNGVLVLTAQSAANVKLVRRSFLSD